MLLMLRFSSLSGGGTSTAVSLAQIDVEVKEAEAVMHGFLKELGYE
jgi:hypothetical protein